MPCPLSSVWEQEERGRFGRSLCISRYFLQSELFTVPSPSVHSCFSMTTDIAVRPSICMWLTLNMALVSQVTAILMHTSPTPHKPSLAPFSFTDTVFHSWWEWFQASSADVEWSLPQPRRNISWSFTNKINIVNMPKGMLFSFSHHSVSVQLVLWQREQCPLSTVCWSWFLVLILKF